MGDQYPGTEVIGTDLSPIQVCKHRGLSADRAVGGLCLATGSRLTGVRMRVVDMLQPHWVPPNVKFVIDDVEDEWVLGDDFDVIHIRHVLPVIRNPEQVIRIAHESVLPVVSRRE